MSERTTLNLFAQKPPAYQTAGDTDGGNDSIRSELSSDVLGMDQPVFIDMLLLLCNYQFYLQLWGVTRGQLNPLQAPIGLPPVQIQAASATTGSSEAMRDDTNTGVLSVLDTRRAIIIADNIVVPGAVPDIASTIKTPASVNDSVTPSYQFKKANDPLYVHYSLWSVFGIVNTALVEDSDLVLFVTSVSVLVAMSLAAKLAPRQFKPGVANTADKLVIGVSGVRDVSRIMTTFALGYWAFSLHASGETIHANVAASDILLGAAADPLFWAMIGVIGLANGYLKYKAKTNPAGLSANMAKLEKSVRGTYMACSTSTMAILLLDCMTSLLSDAVTSGYGLLLAEPITAAVTFSVIATAAMVGAYWGVTSQREPESAAAKTFTKCDNTLSKVRKIFMPAAVIASLLCPELIIVGAVLTIAYLLYDKYQRATKNVDEAVQQDATGKDADESAALGVSADEDKIIKQQPESADERCESRKWSYYP
jgi:hypothetical protein